MDTIQIEGWRMSILHDGEVRSEFTAFSQVLQAGGAAYPAEVPGNFELDLMRAGVITDPFRGDGTVSYTHLTLPTILLV